MVKTYLIFCDGLKESFERIYNEMPESRRKKIDSFRFEPDRLLSLGAGHLIKKYVGNEDEMTVGKNGKLCADGVHFNVSHSGNAAILSVCESEVGCDIEMIKDNNSMRIADRFFFDDEYRLLENETDEKKRRELFFRLWTLKESFMKATGEGFTLALDSFSVNPTGGSITVKQSYSDREYCFKEYKIKNYRLAVCTEGDNDFADEIEIEKVPTER